jgi:hypothetical protein
MTQTFYTYVKSGISSKNYINYSSIARCVNEASGSIDPLRFHYGNVCIPSINISMNKCYTRSAIYCNPSSVSNSVTCSLSYSTIADNKAIDYNCIQFYMSGAEYEIKSCNILRNTQGTLGTEGTISTWGNLRIDDSCILENKATNIFYQANTNCRTTISNCTVDSTSNNGYLTTLNKVTESFILALNHMSTHNCDTGYDAVGTLTPIIQSSSYSNNQVQCFTIGKYFHQLRLREIVFLISILIFNFIHPYVSSDYLY